MVGVYENAEITGSALQAGKSTDDPVVVIHFLIEGEPKSAWLYTTEKAWPYTAKKLAACGFNPGDHDMDLSPLNGEESPIKGNTVRVVIKEEEYEGKIREKIVQIGPDEGFVERMDQGQAASFTSQLRARLLVNRGQQVGAKKPAPKKATPPPAQTKTRDDSEVPF